MAFAEKTTREVRKTITVNEDVIRLDLSREEAETLQVILSHVGGDPHKSHRGHAQSVFLALEKVVGDYDLFDAYRLSRGNVYFDDRDAD